VIYVTRESRTIKIIFPNDEDQPGLSEEFDYKCGRSIMEREILRCSSDEPYWTLVVGDNSNNGK
jgi:hypothetical protein